MMGGLRLAATTAVLVGIVVAAVQADQTDPRLDGLFDRLAAATLPAAARSVEQQIWRIWVEADDPEVGRLMQQGVAAMKRRRLDDALSSFDRMVELAPEFAEGWNKRATVHYLRGDYPASVLDIRRTLALEPRHFGALFGLGLIYDALKKPEAALRSYEAALALSPQSPNTRRRIEQLRRELGGRRI